MGWSSSELVSHAYCKRSVDHLRRTTSINTNGDNLSLFGGERGYFAFTHSVHSGKNLISLCCCVLWTSEKINFPFPYCTLELVFFRNMWTSKTHPLTDSSILSNCPRTFGTVPEFRLNKTFNTVDVSSASADNTYMRWTIKNLRCTYYSHSLGVYLL